MSDSAWTHHRLLIGLSIAFSVLTLTAVAFGVATIALLGNRAAAPGPAPTPTQAAASAPPADIIDGVEITAFSDLAAERFALASSYGDSVSVYVLLTNEDGSQAVEAFFDVTTYREDGSIVDRGLDIVYIPPGDTGVLQVELPEDLSEAESIVIEQTAIDLYAPDVAGGAAVVSMESAGLEDVFEVQLTSELSGPVENAFVYVFAYADDEVIGICELWGDIPTGGSAFDGLCDWAPTPIDNPVTDGTLPDGVEFEAYVRMENPQD